MTSRTHDEHTRSLIDHSAEGFADAAHDASEKARVAARAVKRGVSTGAYNTAYGFSFGVVFAGAFLVELLPVQNPARRGFEDGAEAALDAIRTRHEKARPAPPVRARTRKASRPPKAVSLAPPRVAQPA